MGWLFNRGGDRALAETRYAGRESATARAARQRRAKHHGGSAAQAARAGQDWEDDYWRHIPKTAWFRGRG